MKALMAVGTISRYIFLTPSNEGRPEPFASMVYLQTNLASIAPCDKNSHSDHRELSAHEGAWSYEIVNFMELIGESMGITHVDLFKRLKLMQDVDAILVASQEYIDDNELDPEEVREVVLKDLLGEQFLPIDRSWH